MERADLRRGAALLAVAIKADADLVGRLAAGIAEGLGRIEALEQSIKTMEKRKGKEDGNQET